MRNLGLAAIGALLACSAANVSAATVTYTITGSLTNTSSFGSDGSTLGAALGTPQTFEAVFILDSETPDTIASAEAGYFNLASATVKLDGTTYFSAAVNPGSNRIRIDNFIGNFQVLSFGAASVEDRVAGVAGNERLGIAINFGLSGAPLNPNELPLNNSFSPGNGGGGGPGQISLSNGPSAAMRSVGAISAVTITVTPVPEPGEWAMMAAGLAVVGFAARRRRKG